ncbi:MAG: methionine aminotransferase [Ginsengibacter sp.]
MKIPSLDSKLPHIKETIFTAINTLAAKHKAINLGQGFPDFPMNGDLVEEVYLAMKDGRNQYAHMNGVPALRKAIAEKVRRMYNREIDEDKEITVTPGGTYAIYTALTTILHPGDEVIVLEPAFDSYIPNIEINGARAILVPLSPNDYRIDWKLVKEHVTARTKCIILNSPNNPTGGVLNKNDIQELHNLVKETNIFILSDEVYEHIIFDELDHESILKYQQLYERSFVCFSLGKVYNCTGWKIGYCIAPENLSSEFRKVHQFNCFSCNTPVQFALAKFLKRENEYTTLGKFFQTKRNLLASLLQPCGFIPVPSHGSYFQMYSFKKISSETEMAFATRLCEEAGVACIPVSSFYRNGTDNSILRFCFAKKDETLKEAAHRISQFTSHLGYLK